VLDVVTEFDGGGTDTVRSGVSYVISANIENLVLTGTDAINGTGNDLSNTITGNAANNILDGGAGADTMIGGAGDDTYYIDNAGDRVIENPGDGNDRIITTITLGTIDGIEQITLVGNEAADLTGNAADNMLTGNGAANVLSGGDGKDTLMGGAGNDTLFGDAGNDTLWGQDGNDTMYGGTGTDALNGGAGNDVMDGGEGNDGLFGGGGQDTLFGGDGNDSIFGDGGNDYIRGGAGNDSLAGGQVGGGGVSGNDTFAWLRGDIVDANGAAAGFDTILDFGAGDRLDFSGIFNGAPPVPLADLIRVSDTATGTVVSIDVDANGHFFDVAILNGAHGLDAHDLVQQQIIIA
jgi:Ca2+-binding RTX toxin-like protein